MFAFTHLIVAWLAGKGYERFRKKELPDAAWLLLLFGSLLPDADFLVDWTLGTEIHRTLTHSVLFVVIGFLGAYFIFRKSHERRIIAGALAMGIGTHLFLDMFLSQGVPLFWPSLLHFSFQGIGYFDPATPSFLHQSAEVMRKTLKMAVLDMALGTAWIIYLAGKKRVRF